MTLSYIEFRPDTLKLEIQLEVRKMLNQVLRSDPQIGLFELKQGLLHSSYFVELNQDVHAPLCSTFTLLSGF